MILSLLQIISQCVIIREAPGALFRCNSLNQNVFRIWAVAFATLMMAW
jgi:hypothetical protein